MIILSPFSRDRPTNARLTLLASLSVLLIALDVDKTAASELQSRPDHTFVTDGQVYAVVHSADTIYIGGAFTQVGPRTGAGVGIAADGSPDMGLPEVAGGAGLLNAVAADGAGGWYIGGDFTHVGGVARNNIAHIRPDKSVDPNFNPNPDTSVYSLALSGSTLYVGGNFSSIAGQPRNKIAALNVLDGSATNFNPDADGFGVFAFALSGSTLYVGGNFSSIGGQPRKNIAALNTANGTATSFDPNAADLWVNTLAISGSTIYVGGAFTSIGGQSRNNIAALNTADGTATSWNPNADYDVYTLALSGSIIYVGGGFSSIGGQTRNLIAALNTADGTATSFNPNANAFDPFEKGVYSLAVSGSLVYAGGWFTSIGGQERNYIAALNPADGSATSFNPNANAYVHALALSGSTLYAGGSFTSIGGKARDNIATFNAADGTVTTFNPGLTGYVRALALSGSTLYVGGGFTLIGGQSRSNLAAINTLNGTTTSFNPAANDYVLALARSDATLYVGGQFTIIGGQPRLRIAALNLGGILDGTATSFNPIADAIVWALAVSDSTVYVGGNFSLIGLQPRNYIAALNAADGTATNFNPNADGVVLTLALSGSTLYVGGGFTTIGGQPRNHLAALNVVDGIATDFNPNPNGSDFNSSVFALAVSGSTIYAGGGFTSIAGQPRNYIAGLKTADGTATTFNPNADGSVHALAVAPNGKLYVGGFFKGFDLGAQQGFASFSPTPVQLSAVASRKIHGSAGPFEIDLPLTGPPGIECRSGGTNSDYTIVFSFANPLTSVGGASVTSGTGIVGSAAIGSDAHQYIVDLTGVANAQTITVSLTNVNDSAGNSTGAVSASMGVLIGDVITNKVVSNTDVAEVKGQVAAPITTSNFRNDVNTNGVITNTDVSTTKVQVGISLP
jgi:trimeric autotransporter adhesin